MNTLNVIDFSHFIARFLIFNHVTRINMTLFAHKNMNGIFKKRHFFHQFALLFVFSMLTEPKLKPKNSIVKHNENIYKF